jgi:hypothetical protein
VRERERDGLGRAILEAKAQKVWGGAGWPKAKAQAAGPKPKLGPIQEIKPFQILFGIQIFGKVWKFAQGDLEGILT